MKICENCNKKHDGSYGSGRFCSKSCRSSFAGKQTKNRVCNLPMSKGRGNWRCCYCDLIFESRSKLSKHKKEIHPNLSKSAWNKGLTKYTSDILFNRASKLKQRYKNGELTPTFKGKHWSDEDKIRISKHRKQYLEKHPEKVPYLLNHSSKISYPERYFNYIIKKEQINAKYHLQVGRYQLDFYNISLKKYFEVDGEHHYVDKKTIKIDQERTLYLNNLRLGWYKNTMERLY